MGFVFNSIWKVVTLLRRKAWHVNWFRIQKAVHMPGCTTLYVTSTTRRVTYHKLYQNLIRKKNSKTVTVIFVGK